MKTSKTKKFRWPEGRRAALSLSWDDARPSAVEAGVPILDQFGIKGTFYVLPRNMKRQLKKWRAAAANGFDGLRNYVKWIVDKYPSTRGEIKRVFADGDHVILHCHYPGNPGQLVER